MNEIDYDKYEYLHKAYEYWTNLKIRMHFRDGDSFVLIHNEDYEINEITLRLMDYYKKYKEIDNLYIITDIDQVEQYANTVIKNEFVYIKCSVEEAEMLCLLSWVVKGLTSGLIINTFKNNADHNTFDLVNKTEVTKYDIVSLCILQLGRIPTELDLKENLIYQRKKDTNDFEEESKYDAWVPRERILFSSIDDYADYIISKLLKGKYITEDNNIFLFGYSNLSQSIIKSDKIAIKGVVDNNRNSVIKREGYSDIEVNSPNSLLIPYNPNNRILVCIYSYKEVCRQLHELGYELGKHVYIINYGMGKYNDNSEEIFKYYIRKDLEIGCRLYCSLIETYNYDKVIVCPYPGTGDIYLICLYLSEYIRKLKINNYLIIFASMAAKKVANLFGVDGIVLSYENILKLLKYSRLCNERDKIVVLNDDIDMDRGRHIRGVKGLDFNSLFQVLLFQDAKKRRNNTILIDHADDIFSTYNLRKRKTIILSPYANTLISLSEQFWSQLARAIIEKGYDVCTNVATGKEHPIACTTGICVPYNQIIDFANNSCLFIGLRSGLCDLLTVSKLTMIVLYQGKDENNQSLINYFSLINMGLREKNIYEFECDSVSEIELMEEIMKLVD